MDLDLYTRIRNLKRAVLDADHEAYELYMQDLQFHMQIDIAVDVLTRSLNHATDLGFNSSHTSVIAESVLQEICISWKPNAASRYVANSLAYDRERIAEFDPTAVATSFGALDDHR